MPHPSEDEDEDDINKYGYNNDNNTNTNSSSSSSNTNERTMMPSSNNNHSREISVRDQEISRLQNHVNALSNKLESVMQENNNNRNNNQAQVESLNSWWLPGALERASKSKQKQARASKSNQ